MWLKIEEHPKNQKNMEGSIQRKGGCAPEKNSLTYELKSTHYATPEEEREATGNAGDERRCNDKEDESSAKSLS